MNRLLLLCCFALVLAACKRPAEMQAFLVKHPVVYPVAILDVYNPPKDFATPRGLPTTYLIAPDGKVAKHFLGPVTANDIDAAIANAGGPKPAT
jgi:hypothetical protein